MSFPLYIELGGKNPILLFEIVDNIITEFLSTHFILPYVSELKFHIFQR